MLELANQLVKAIENDEWDPVFLDVDPFLNSLHERFGLEVGFVAQGGCRAVFRIGDYALKVALDDVGILQNKIENQVWGHLEEEDRSYFATIYLSDIEGRWILMEYVEGVTESKDRAVIEALKAIAQRYDLHEGEFVFEDEVIDNVAVFDDGTFKIVDYGCDNDLFEEFYKINL